MSKKFCARPEANLAAGMTSTIWQFAFCQFLTLSLFYFFFCVYLQMRRVARFGPNRPSGLNFLPRSRL